MSLGTLLIKPQPLTRPPQPAADPTEVLADIVEALLRDPQAALVAAPIIRDAIGNTFVTLVEGYQERVRLSDGKIRSVFQPFAAVVEELAGGLGGNVLDSIPAVLKALAGLLDQLSSAKIAALVRQLADIAEKDLGISAAQVFDLFTDVTARIALALKQRFLDGDASGEAHSLYDIGSSLDGLSLLLAGEMRPPALDVEVLVQALLRVWKDARIDPVLAGLRQILSNTADVVPAVKALVEIKLEAGAQVHPIAAGGQAELDAARYAKEPIAWYASWVACQTVRRSSDTAETENLYANEFLAGFTYKKISRETMEQIAYHTAWIFPEVEAVIFHVTSMEQGDVLSNLNTVALDLTKAGLVANPKCEVPDWVEWVIWPFTTVIPWGWEAGWNRLGEAYPWVNAAGDLGEIVLYRRWVWLMRELLLSFLTLLNNDSTQHQELVKNSHQLPEKIGAAVNTARNTNCFHGVCYAFGELVSMIVPAVLASTDRVNYGFVDGGPTSHMIARAVAGQVLTMGSYLLGLLLAGLVALEMPSPGVDMLLLCLRERMFGRYDMSTGGKGTWSVVRALAALFSYLPDQLMYLYLFTDGNTDGGEWCVDAAGKENGKLPGYRDSADSPYLLPWSGENKQCVQGNLGIWSHYPQGFQHYAYDFSHDMGDEVLASRPGIIVGIQDTTPNRARKNPVAGAKAWNFVEVLHLNVDAAGEPLTPLAGGLQHPAWPNTTTTSAAAAGATALALNDASAFPSRGQAIAGGQVISYTNKAWNMLKGIPASGPGAITTPIASGANAWAAVFADGVTGIPPETKFPPYWDANGVIRFQRWDGSNAVDWVPPLHPGAAYMPAAARTAMPAYYQSTDWGFKDTDKFRFLDPVHDRAAIDSADPNGPGLVLLTGGKKVPLKYTKCAYGHGLFSFMRVSVAVAASAPNTPNRPMVDIYKSRNANEVLGLYVQQRQVIMLADCTGISAYSHLHTHVLALEGLSWTIPFVYRDCTHTVGQHGLREGCRTNGTPRAFTFYTPDDARVDPYA